jgi:hypothetical protein
LGNGPDDQPVHVPCGDCAIAGPEHITMLWTAEAGTKATFDYSCTIANYSAITGYDPSQTQPDGSNPTDQGTDMTAQARYWQSNGMVDAAGNTHKIAAYVGLTPGNLHELYAAAYLFGAVGIGIQVPSSAQDQFDAGRPWTVVPGDSIEGGHFVPVIARRADGIRVVTWGQEQVMTEPFFVTYCDEAFVYFSDEMLVDGKSIDGFDAEALIADLKAVTHA